MRHKVGTAAATLFFLAAAIVNSYASISKGQLLFPFEKGDLPIKETADPYGGFNAEYLKEAASNKVYIVTDIDGKNAWGKIDGVIVKLELDESKSEQKIPFMEAKEGDHFRRIFVSKDLAMAADYSIARVAEQDDCVRIYYAVAFKVTKGERSQSMKLVYARGC